MSEGQAEERDPLVGRVVAGKFRIERMLGAGAMGRVYLAEQLNLGKQVALKVLHARMAGDASLEKRFHREARHASQLAHPNILSIIDFGDEDGLLYIAMELLQGRDLLRVFRAEWPLSAPRIAHIMGQVLSALDEAHAKNIVHRDLKPENVMLVDVRGEPDYVKVCDFGIAKAIADRDEGSLITVAGSVCGTPEYMSPEQARGEPLDGRSDLYAIAIMLYQLVTGELPFRAESALGVVTKQLTEQPVPPSKRSGGARISPELEAVILRGMAKTREERFASAVEMRQELYAACGVQRGSSPSQPQVPSPRLQIDEHAATGVATPIPPAAPVSSATLASAPTIAPVPPTSTSTAPRGRAVVWVSSVLTVAGGAAVLLMMARTGQPPAAVAPTPVTTAQPPPPPEVKAPPPEVKAPPPEVKAPPPEVKAPPPEIKPVVAAVEPRGHRKSIRTPPPAKPVAPITPAPIVTPTPAQSPFADGEALFKGGNIEAALAKYEQAARANPGDARAQRQLGKCYNRLGQRDRAAPYFKRYLELAPDASDAAFIRAMLDGK